MSATRSRWYTRLAVLGLAMATAVTPAQASLPLHAAPTDEAREAVVVLPIQPSRGLDSRLARDLDLRVAHGLERGQFTVIAADTVRAQVPAGACETTCLQAIAAATGARYLVRTAVVVDGRDYQLQLTLWSWRQRRPVGL